MKKLFFFATILLASPLWGDGRGAAQIANEPGSGNCLAFDGNNDYINVSSDPTLNFGSGDFTVEAWVYLNSLNSGSIVSSADNYQDVGFDLRIRSGFVMFNCGCPSAGAPCNNNDSGVNSTSFPTDKWIHVTGVKKSDSVFLYNNSILVASGPLLPSTQTLTSGKPVRVGRSHADIDGAGFYLDGKIDEVRIWNRALSQAEIQQNMCQKLADCADPNLVGYWRFDEGADNTCSGGQDVCDASCNGNNGVKF